MLPAELAGGVTTVLNDINVDPAVIDRIVKVIRDSDGELDQPFGQLQTSAMDGCDGGATFAHHTELAREHVVQAMQDILTGLRGLEQVVQDYSEVQQQNDAESASAGYKIKSRLDASDNCFTPPTPESPEVCSPQDVAGEDG